MATTQERTNIKQPRGNNWAPYLKPHYVYAGLTVGVYLLSTILPGWSDATIYHLDFKKVFGEVQIWRLVTCLLVAG